MRKLKLSWNVFIIFFLLIFCAKSLIAAGPSITSVSGTTANAAVLTVDGYNFGTSVAGYFSDYFDLYTSQWIYNSTNDCLTPGNWSRIGILDGDVDRRESSGFSKNLLEISSGIGNYSTGYGFRKMQGYASFNYGMWNQFLAKNLPDDNKEFWLRFYMKWGDPTFPWPTPTSNWVQSKQIWFRLGDGQDNGQWILEGAWYGSFYTQYRFVSQNLGGSSRYTLSDKSLARFPGNDKWFEVRVHFKMETPDEYADNGVIEYYFNGRKVLEHTNVNFTNEAESLEFYRIDVGGNISITSDGGQSYLFGSDPPESSFVYYDDITITLGADDPGSIAAVYLSNNPIWGQGVSDRWNGDSNFIRQKVGGSDQSYYGFKSWSDNRFMFEVSLGALDTSKPIYLYVTNWNGETNSSGFPVDIGDEVPSRPSNFQIIE